MHQVSVSYFKDNKWINGVWRYYLESEAAKMYQAAINKYTEKKDQVLICLRDENHALLKSERKNF